jgi:hypothetical protein
MSGYVKERYKLRCEVWGDFAQLYERAAAAGTPIRQLATTIEIVFQYAGPLYLLQELCRQIEDGHIMEETVALESEYTGKRRPT